MVENDEYSVDAMKTQQLSIDLKNMRDSLKKSMANKVATEYAISDLKKLMADRITALKELERGGHKRLTDEEVDKILKEQTPKVPGR